MNKEKLVKELTKLAKSNNDLGKFGDGYEKAINEAIQLVKKCSIPDFAGRSEQLSQCKCGNTVQIECDDCKDNRIMAKYI